MQNPAKWWRFFKQRHELTTAVLLQQPITKLLGMIPQDVMKESKQTQAWDAPTTSPQPSASEEEHLFGGLLSPQVSMCTVPAFWKGLGQTGQSQGPLPNFCGLCHPSGGTAGMHVSLQHSRPSSHPTAT